MCEYFHAQIKKALTPQKLFDLRCLALVQKNTFSERSSPFDPKNGHYGLVNGCALMLMHKGLLSVIPIV